MVKDRYKISKNGFIDQYGKLSKTIETELIEDNLVLEKQDKSLDEYHDTHEQENLSLTILYVMNQFRRFIGYHLALSSHNLNYPPFILDVGCGISKKIPLYFREII